MCNLFHIYHHKKALVEYGPHCIYTKKWIKREWYNSQYPK